MALTVPLVPIEMVVVDRAVLFRLCERVAVALAVLFGAMVIVALDTAVLLKSCERVAVASAVVFRDVDTVAGIPSVSFEGIEMVAVAAAVSFEVCEMELAVEAGGFWSSGISAVAACMVYISVVYSGGAVSINVVTMVDGVTRQLQILLKRSGANVAACVGGTGGACLFKGGETTEAVALGELPIYGSTVALLVLQGSEDAVALTSMVTVVNAPVAVTLRVVVYVGVTLARTRLDEAM